MRLSGLFQSTVFRLVVGIVLFIVVFVALAGSFELDDVIQAISDFPLGALSTLLIAAFLVSVLKGARFHVLVKHAGIEITFWKTLRLFLASQAATPIPAGETIRGALLKQETGASLGKVAGPVLGQAVYEIAAAAVIVFAASLFYPELFVPSLIAIMVLVVVIGVLLHRKSFDALLDLMSNLPFFDKNFYRIRTGREYFRQNFALLGKGGFDRHVFGAIVLAFAAQLMGGLLVAIAAHAFDVPINFFQATLVYASGAILQGIFTIIPAGLGVTEGGMSGILHVLGVDLSLALALVIIIRIATLLFPVVLGFVLFAIFYAKQTFFIKKT
jgi:uncharacterized membrane protein YbhN (UPF0104 family)